MKKIFGFSVFVIFIGLGALQLGVSSCTKTTTVHDSVTVINRDTVIEKDSLPKVNPGNDTTYHLTSYSDSIKLSGSATYAYGSITAFLWSQVSGPNKALITDPGSAITYVSGLDSGTYIFQLMAIDNNGRTGVKNISITIIEPHTATLQPSNNPYDVMLGYSASSGDITNPGSPELVAEAWTSGGAAVTLRGLFKFNLNSLPAGAKIISAKLSLYSDPTPENGDLVHANGGTANAFLVQRVTSNWDNTVTWATQPSTDATSQIIIPTTSQSSLDITNLDVTSMVQAMQQTGNYGFMIKLQSETIYNTRIFASSRNADLTKHPALTIVYSN